MHRGVSSHTEWHGLGYVDLDYVVHDADAETDVERNKLKFCTADVPSYPEWHGLCRRGCICEKYWVSLIVILLTRAKTSTSAGSRLIKDYKTKFKIPYNGSPLNSLGCAKTDLG